MKSKRLVAIVVMALVAMVTPATYQMALEPRIMAKECSIEINAIRLNEELTSSKTVVFNAYLKITNFEKTDVILSKLDLDVYYRVEGKGYHDIGDMSTSTEYIIPAATDSENGMIESYYDQDNQLQTRVRAPAAPKDKPVIKSDYIKGGGYVVATLNITQEGVGSDAAIKDLVDGCLTLKLSGTAKAGSFTFDYKNTITIEENLWDPNFVIADVFNYYSHPDLDYEPMYRPGSNETDTNIIVIRAKMHNPSPIPMIIEDYQFNLTYKNTETVVAVGIPSERLSQIYDPNYRSTSRYSLMDVYMGGERAIKLPGVDQTGAQGEALEHWKDIILAFNFTDPNYPNQPNNANSKTKDRINEFMNLLFSKSVIDDYELVGKFKLRIGSLSSTAQTGVVAFVGYDKEFRIDDTTFYQFPDAALKTTIKVDGVEHRLGGDGYTEEDYESFIKYTLYPTKYPEPDPWKQPIALKDLFSVGNLEVNNIEINRSKSGYPVARGDILSIFDNELKLNISASQIDYPNLHQPDTFMIPLEGSAKLQDFLINTSEPVVEEDIYGNIVHYYNITVDPSYDLSAEGVSVGQEVEILYVPQEISMDVTSELTFENPYRLKFNITDLAATYYRTPQTNQLNQPIDPDTGAVIPDKTVEDLTFEFGSGITPHSTPLEVQPAFVNKSDIELSQINPKKDFNSTVTTLTHEISLTYNTLDYRDTGIARFLEDIGIDPQTINYTDPLWLLGPYGMKDSNGNTFDEAELLKYLISNNVDPLMLLRRVNTSVIHYYGDNAYYPLECSFFGTNAKVDQDGRLISNDDNPRTISKAFFVQDSGVISGGGSVHNIYYPFTIYSDAWSSHPYGVVGDSGNNPNDDYRSQYDIFKRATGSWDLPDKADDDAEWSLPDEDNLIEGNLRAFITRNLVTEEVSGFKLSQNDIPSEDDVIWNIYADSNSDFWGLFYDIETYIHNWYMIHGTGSNKLLFMQDIKLNATANPELSYNDYKIHDVDEIEKATLSISYRYPQGSSSPTAGFGIASWDGSKWVYPGSFIVWGPTITGWECPGTRADTTNVDDSKTYDMWKHTSVDVTDIIKEAYTNYRNAYLSGDPDAEDYLHLEVYFGAKSGVVYFDDVVLEIDYVNTREEPFRLKDLFKYLQDHAPEDGNMYNFLDAAGMDAINMTAYMENNPPMEWTDEYDPNLSDYLMASDSSIEHMIQILEDNVKDIGLGQGLSLLEMLNQSKYTIDANPENNVPTPYGPRSILHSDDEGWIIEDPYYASQKLVQALQNEIFTDDYGSIKYGQFFGKELWMLLDNLHVSVSDIVLYLLMHGWSKDDIFDLFEALGFAKMTKYNYRLDVLALDALLSIRELILYEAEVSSGQFIDLQFQGSDEFNMTYTSDRPLDPSVLKVYMYLCSEASDPNNPLSLINTQGAVNPPYIYEADTIEGTGKIKLGPFTVATVTMYLDSTFTLEEYGVSLDLVNPTASRIAPEGTYDNPYLEVFGDKGLNDAGAALLTHYLRQTIEFDEAPFIEMPGDILGLFTFLDKYFFTNELYYLPYHSEFNPNPTVPYTYDYSSYTILNYFDVSAKDFVEAITGYDQFTGTFDPNGNGRADDWTAPQGPHSEGGYGWDNTTEPVDENGRSLIDYGSGGGWGIKVKDNRLYWNRSYFNNNGHTNKYFGKIIWSDSPRFLEKDFDGNVTDPDDMDDGAPPIVNLIDMFLWLSKVDPDFNSKLLFEWLLGDLSFLNYTQNKFDLYGQVIPQWYIKRGLGLQKTWNWLRDCKFNVTGMIKWLENVKGVNPFKYLYAMNSFSAVPGSESPDPNALFYFMRNPNFFIYEDGTVGFVEHQGLGGTRSEAIDSYWNYFNGSWWNEYTGTDTYWNTNINTWTETLAGSILYEILKLEQETQNNAFNIFEILEQLDVQPEDWINALQEMGIKPLELLAVYQELDLTQLIASAAAANKKTRMKINGTFHLEFFGMNLYDAIQHPNNEMSYVIGPVDLYVSDHFSNFINISQFSTDNGNYIIYS